MTKLVFIFLFVCHLATSQNQQRVKGELQYGYIIPHSSAIASLSHSEPWGFSAAYQVMPAKRNYWDACNCFYYLGAQFSYTNFGNYNVLGDAFTIAATFEPILWRNSISKISLNSGVGVAYLSRVYHPINNPDNLFFSAPLSFLLFLSPTFEYRLGEKLSLSASLSYNHISNGGQKQPNKGVNYPQIGVGLNSYINQTPLPEYSVSQPVTGFTVFFEGGYTTRKTGVGNSRKAVFSGVGAIYYSLGVVNAFGGGVEFVNDYSIDSSANRHSLAPFLSHHFLLGRFDFSQRMSYYAIRPSDVTNINFYQRYVVKFNLTSDLFLGFSLKAHGHVASNLDLRIGWRF